MSTESDQIAAECMDAGRTAIAVLRYLRAGDHASAMALTATLSPREQTHFVGAMASLANQAFNVIDQVCEYARNAGVSELTQTSDDVLSVIALGFASE